MSTDGGGRLDLGLKFSYKLQEVSSLADTGGFVLPDFPYHLAWSGSPEEGENRKKGTAMNSMRRGALIVFEGCDRSGKSTQCAKLVERLTAEGNKVQLLKFPNRTTTIGQMIDNYLKQSVELDDHTIHLLFSANRWECMQSMKKALQEGTTLIVDRYAYSGVAFTAAKGLSTHWCRQPDIGLLKPDRVIFMTVSSQCAAGRSDFGQERYEKVDFQQKVSRVFEELKDSKYWQEVRGDGSIEEVHGEVYKIASGVIEAAADKPLQELWQEYKPSAHIHGDSNGL